MFLPCLAVKKNAELAEHGMTDAFSSEIPILHS